MKVPSWAWIAWAVAGLVLEAVALVNGVGGDTLTEQILAASPGWVIYMGLGWLLWHFREAK